MVAVVSPSTITGIVSAPASKSIMQRACALALLNVGTTSIGNPGKSEDDLAALQIIQDLGAVITNLPDGSINIRSGGEIHGEHIIHCGESGLSMRMFTAIASLGDANIKIQGRGSLLNRPVGFPDAFFPDLQVAYSSNNGFLPLVIRGPLQPKGITIDGSLSSQYVTGILFAYAKAVQQPVAIRVENLKSKPYIDVSLQMLEQFGYDVTQTGYEIFTINPVAGLEQNVCCRIEGDWSNAAFLLVAGAIAGNIVVKGLDPVSAQGDKAILDVLTSCGAGISITGDQVSVKNKNGLKPFDFDATDYPDLFPPLAILAACCKGRSTLKGVSRLIGKESNRADALNDILSSMKIDMQIDGDLLHIAGGKGIAATDLRGHKDHRIVMAAAVAALVAEGNMKISDAESVSKSYPDFFAHLQLLGAGVSLQNNQRTS